jgi:hypothetical protein
LFSGNPSELKKTPLALGKLVSKAIDLAREMATSWLLNKS